MEASLEYLKQYTDFCENRIGGVDAVKPDGLATTLTSQEVNFVKPFATIKPFDLTGYQELINTQQFKKSRQAQLDSAIITTQSGKQFDADEASIIRLGNALVAADGEPEDTIIKWSLANDGTGVMTDCAKAEIREAHRLAMENMSAIWSV